LRLGLSRYWNVSKLGPRSGILIREREIAHQARVLSERVVALAIIARDGDGRSGNKSEQRSGFVFHFFLYLKISAAVLIHRGANMVVSAGLRLY
jgi:hypothetical protein